MYWMMRKPSRRKWMCEDPERGRAELGSWTKMGTSMEGVARTAVNTHASTSRKSKSRSYCLKAVLPLHTHLEALE